MEQGRFGGASDVGRQCSRRVASRCPSQSNGWGWGRHTISSCDGVDIHVALEPSCAAEHRWRRGESIGIVSMR
jgi:hypothetical protein